MKHKRETIIGVSDCETTARPCQSSPSPLSQKGVPSADSGGLTLNELASIEEIKLNARELRKNATKQENHLWYGFLCSVKPQILRQRPIGKYIVDFYCHAAKLAIELDGSQHYTSEAIEYDKIRTAYINSLGIEVMRFDNSDVDNNFAGVCDEIRAIIERRNPPPLRRHPLLQKGAEE